MLFGICNNNKKYFMYVNVDVDDVVDVPCGCLIVDLFENFAFEFRYN
jgi:hypothetical protein